MRLALLIGLLSNVILYGQNGSLKTDFGNAGKMSLDIDDLDDLVGIIKDDQGNTYFYGNTSDNQGGIYPFDYFIGKMDEYGNIDQTFGNNGISRHDFPGFEISSLTKAVYHDNKIYFMGQGINGTSLDTFGLFLGKMDLNGDIDLNFANSGYFTSDFLGTYNTAGSLIIDSNDKIVFCGSTTDDQGVLVEFPLLGRLHLNGTPDSTLGNTGLVVYDYYQDTVIDACDIPPYYLRHGDGAYLSEIVEYNNAYFVTGKFLGTSYSQLHVMSFTQTGAINPNFISAGPFIFQVDPGSNHYLHDIAFDGATFYLAFETQSMYDGYHMIQQVDTSGAMGAVITINETGYFMRTNFIEFWNGRLFVGGYNMHENNLSPGYHSDNTRIYCLDANMNQVNSFNFIEDMGSGDEQGAEGICFHNNYGITGGYMNNVVGDNYTDLYFMAFEVNDQHFIEEKSNSIQYYPNPATEYIQSNEPIGSYQIFSLSGKLVQSGKANYQVNISGLSSGTYLLQTERGSQRLVIQGM